MKSLMMKPLRWALRWTMVALLWILAVTVVLLGWLAMSLWMLLVVVWETLKFTGVVKFAERMLFRVVVWRRHRRVRRLLAEMAQPRAN